MSGTSSTLPCHLLEDRSPKDITTLVLEDHHEQRRMFAMLDDIDRGDTATLAAVWRRGGDRRRDHRPLLPVAVFAATKRLVKTADRVAEEGASMLF